MSKDTMSDELRDDTRLALRLSIEHWERMANEERIHDKDGELENTSSECCALCAIYCEGKKPVEPSLGRAFHSVYDTNPEFNRQASGCIVQDDNGTAHKCPLYIAEGVTCFEMESTYVSATCMNNDNTKWLIS